MRPLVIGSRGSRLALWQARFVCENLQRVNPGLEVSIQRIKTTGDRFMQASLAKLNLGKGVFVKEIEEALMEGRVDLAVHSLKDLPTELPAGLKIGAVLPREDPRDALVGPGKVDQLSDLPSGSRIGTGSLRRTVQLKSLRPDLKVEPIRGNVDTRIRKIRQDALAGVVLAMAGLRRLGLEEKVAYVFASEEMTPAVGQGALAVEVRDDDLELQTLLGPLNDQKTLRCVEAERAFLDRMGGGCHVPMGAYAEINGSEASFSAFVASPAGDCLVRDRREGAVDDLPQLAAEATDSLIEQGAKELLKQQ